jgi:class 3 adenylate cyclase
MHEALRLHDDIMCKSIAAHQGYEVTTEGDAFHIAYHDKSRRLRGLWVRMVIHHEEVACSDNEVSGQWEYMVRR